MDPLTLALATFGVQKLRGKSTGRSFRDAFLVGGGAYGIGQLGGAGMGIGQGAPFSGAKAFWGSPSTAGVTHGHAPLNVAAKKGTGVRGLMEKVGPWWNKQGTAAKLGYGTAAAVGLGEVFKGDAPKPPFTEEDYKKASIPMLPITSGVKTTKLNIFIYSLILFPTVLLPYFLNYYGLIYLISSTRMSTYYLFISYKLLIEKNSNIEKKLATKLFGYSILYLFMIFVFILVDKAV